MEYPALMDGEDGAYGVVFPDIPGIAAMGHTTDEVLRNAEVALNDYAIEAYIEGEELVPPSPMQSVKVPAGSRIVSVSLARHKAEIS